MRAELLDASARFEVNPELQNDGTIKPPESVTITLRPCWQKPPVRMELKLAYELEHTAYYARVNE